jgi:transposase-like protein
LKQDEDGSAIAEVCRKAGISEATFYNWRKKYAGLMPSEMKRLRQLEDGNQGADCGGKHAQPTNDASTGTVRRRRPTASSA